MKYSVTAFYLCIWSVQASVCLGTALLKDVPSQVPQAQKPVRFWIDEFPFSEGETKILRESIEGSQGAAVLAGETTKDSLLASKGYYVPEQWDIYWTSTKACHKAFRYMREGQKVNCVPGTDSITDKYNLIVTLLFYFGDGAFQIIPRSYLLPQHYWAWRLHLARQGRGALRKPWVLKDKGHRGSGVHVMAGGRATSEARSRGTWGGLKHDLLQEYMANQLTIDNRRSYLRVWVLLTSVAPLRVYLHEGGLVVFGAPVKHPTRGDAGDEPTTADYIVNHWGESRESAPLWTLADLAKYLETVHGRAGTFEGVWSAVKRSLGLVFAAATPQLLQEGRAAGALPGAGFSLMGADFLLTEKLQPILLEVNALPSLARKGFGGSNPEGDRLGFDVQKERLVQGLLQVLLTTSADDPYPDAVPESDGYNTSPTADPGIETTAHKTHNPQATNPQTPEHARVHSEGHGEEDAGEGAASRQCVAELGAVGGSGGGNCSMDKPHDAHDSPLGRSLGEGGRIQDARFSAAKGKVSGSSRNDGSEGSSAEAWLDGLGPQTQRVLQESCREARVAARHGFQLLPFAPQAEALSAELSEEKRNVTTWSVWSSCLGDMGMCEEGTRPPRDTRDTCDACDAREVRAACAGKERKGFLGRWGRWVVRVLGCLDRQLQGWRARVADALPVVDSEVVFGMAEDIPGADWVLLRIAGFFSPPSREQRAPEVEYHARALDRLVAERLHLCVE